MTNNAKRMMADYKIDSSVATDLEPKHWAEDSYKISSTFVYNGLEQNKKISDEYKKAGLTIAEKQVVIGGTRLANLLMSLGLGQE